MYDLQHILSADKPDFDAMTKEEVMYWVGSCDILLIVFFFTLQSTTLNLKFLLSYESLAFIPVTHDINSTTCSFR